MMSPELFAVSTFCSIHNIEHEFISTLHAEGLISITYNNEGEFIEEDQLQDLELYTRWHNDLGINPAGIDVIRHLVQKIRDLQCQMNLLKSKLRVYDEGEEYFT